MIWLIKECNGFQYEDSWENILGYYDNEEDALAHKKRLDDKFDNFNRLESEFNEKEEELRALTEDTKESYEIFDKAMAELCEEYGYSDAYGYDWYSVEVEKVEKLSIS